MLEAENKSQLELKPFTLILRVSFYCNYKCFRTLAFASIHIYKTKAIECNSIWSRNKLKYNTNYSKSLNKNRSCNFSKKVLNST